MDDAGRRRLAWRARLLGTPLHMQQPPAVLLVDPFDDERDIYAMYLRGTGFQVRAFSDANAACGDAAQIVPDAVVARLRQTDPSLNGFEIVRRVRGHEATRDVPVIIITTSIRAENQRAAHAAGCNAYLLLPCSPPELATELRRVLHEPR